MCLMAKSTLLGHHSHPHHCPQVLTVQVHFTYLAKCHSFIAFLYIQDKFATQTILDIYLMDPPTKVFSLTNPVRFWYVDFRLIESLDHSWGPSNIFLHLGGYVDLRSIYFSFWSSIK